MPSDGVNNDLALVLMSHPTEHSTENTFFKHGKDNSQTLHSVDHSSSITTPDVVILGQDESNTMVNQKVDLFVDNCGLTSKDTSNKQVDEQVEDNIQDLYVVGNELVPYVGRIIRPRVLLVFPKR